MKQRTPVKELRIEIMLAISGDLGEVDCRQNLVLNPSSQSAGSIIFLIF